MNRPPMPGPIPKRPTLPLTGGCPCGAIRYEISAYPLLLYACHCTNCQRQSGSAFALNMPVATKAFHIVRGEPKGWRQVSSAGTQTVSRFCGDCGGRVNGERADRSGSVNVRAGTLDDTSWLTPEAHVFVRSAQPWLRLSDAACFDAAPPDFKALAEAWMARWTL